MKRFRPEGTQWVHTQWVPTHHSSPQRTLSGEESRLGAEARGASLSGAQPLAVVFPGHPKWTVPRSCPAPAALRRPPPARRRRRHRRPAIRSRRLRAGWGGRRRRFSLRRPSRDPCLLARARTARVPARSARRDAGLGSPPPSTLGQQTCLWATGRRRSPAAAERTAGRGPRLLTDEKAGVRRGRVNTHVHTTRAPRGNQVRVLWPCPCREAGRCPDASMPWDSRPGGSAHSGPEGTGAARLRVQKQCRKSSFAFYQAVRDRLPVWLLEDMRASEAFHWDERGRAAAYSPSEALLYALVHDHQAYAHYLLATFPRRALAPPSAGFRCCAAPGPHVALAVRYNRVGILRRILRTVRDFPAEERTRLLDRRGCSRVEGGGTSLHVACELARPECLFLLLGHGASPGLRDGGGLTPLELLLHQLGRDAASDAAAAAAASEASSADATSTTKAAGEPRQRRLLLLDLLALYAPVGAAGPARCELLGDRLRWQRLLGEDKFQWLAGLAPPSLFVRAMQVLVTTISPRRFPEALDELPLPPFLQPLDLTGKS